jgi:hypothetical protein
MDEDAATLTSPSPKQLREACATTRARITAQVDEVEARLRERVEAVIGTDTARATAKPGTLDLLRAIHRRAGPGITAMVVGAAVGYIAARPWALDLHQRNR